MKNNLEIKRLEKGVPQLEVAKAIGCGKSHYCNLESGSRNPSLKMALLLAKYFNTTVEDLFEIPQPQLRETSPSESTYRNDSTKES